MNRARSFETSISICISMQRNVTERQQKDVTENLNLQQMAASFFFFWCSVLYVRCWTRRVISVTGMTQGVQSHTFGVPRIVNYTLLLQTIVEKCQDFLYTFHARYLLRKDDKD